MNKVVLTDACFWLGLVDPRDQYHTQSNEISEVIENNKILFPWPCVYETITTRLARQRERLIFFEKLLNKPEIIRIDDSEYRENAMIEVFESNRMQGFTYSLADGVIREILKDVNTKVDYLVTYNEKDFADLCHKRKIKIFNQV